MESSLLELENITKVYTLDAVEVRALRGVSLSIPRGDFVAIMGASGSGKTTLMNIIGCMDRPTAGTYRVDGEEVSRIDSDRLAHMRNAKFGFIFQNFNLLGRATAAENVELPLLYWNRVPVRERRRRVGEMLDRVGLGDRAAHRPNQLSGGQQQRLAIARALVNRPLILLADEPTGNLDSQSEQDIMTVFQQLHSAGITIIVITHNPEIARYARRTIRIRDGQIQESAP